MEQPEDGLGKKQSLNFPAPDAGPQYLSYLSSEK